MTDYEDYDALGLAALVQGREVSPTELLDAAITRMEERDPVLNAVVTPLFDAARAQVAAGLPEGPFTGVPFLVKELVAAVAGTASSAASRLYRAAIAPADSEIVARFRRAGLVIAGKTNSPEFGLVTDDRVAALRRYPQPVAAEPRARRLERWLRRRSGSRLRTGGACDRRRRLDSHPGVRVRSVRTEADAGPHHRRAGPRRGSQRAGGPTRRLAHGARQRCHARHDRRTTSGRSVRGGAAEPSLAEEISVAPERLRIGFARSAPTGVPLHPDCVAAVEDAARLCESLGHHVEEASPSYDALALERGFITVFSAHLMANVARATGGALPEPGLVEPLTYALADRGRQLGAAEFIGALHRLHRESRRIAAFFERFDLWLTPTLAQPPLPIGHFEIESGDVDRWIARLGAFTPFTYPFNVTGQPAASVPLHWSADGLPIGCQFVARYGDEALLFRIAAQLELARPWFKRRPLGGAAIGDLYPAPIAADRSESARLA